MCSELMADAGSHTVCSHGLTIAVEAESVFRHSRMDCRDTQIQLIGLKADAGSHKFSS